MARNAGKVRGFTLVELLIVIGIIALLMGILLPALSRARQNAQEIACMNNMRQLGMGFLMYSDTFKGYIPADGGNGTSSQPVTQATSNVGGKLLLDWDSQELWFNAIPPYAGEASVYEQSQGIGGPPAVGGKGLFVCPSCVTSMAAPADVSAGVQTDASGCYLLHGAPAGSHGKGDQVRRTFVCYVLNSKLNATQPVQRMAQLDSTVALLVEKRMTQGEIPTNDPNYGKSLGQLKAEWKRFAGRHNKGGNILFADGHVAWFSVRELETPLTSSPLDYNDPAKVVWDPFGPEN